jgi:hypothetical protein
VVVDVDDRAARERLAQLVAAHGPLVATVALTGRGQHHWLALLPGSYRSRNLGGLEFKATTAVTLPPSWHPRGRRYRWLLNDPLVAGGFPPAPAWLVDLVRRPSVSSLTSESTTSAPNRSGANGSPTYRGTGVGFAPALRRLQWFVEAVKDADDGRHDLLNAAWFAAGSFAANGWLDAEWAEAEVLVPLTRQCGAKHVHNLSGFRAALRAGLSDPTWARRPT